MNRLKIYIWIGAVFVLILGTLAHFVYGWSGDNFIVGLFAPVNESTWEHMKLVFFPMLIYTAFVENKLSEEYPCILESLCVGILVGTWLVAFLYYGYSGVLGFNIFILDLAVFIISVLAAFWTAYRLTLSGVCMGLQKFKVLLLVLVGVMAVCFMVYSYKPLGIGVFKIP
jgi:hypothetical protein